MVARTLKESLHGPRRFTSPSSMSKSQHGRTTLRRSTITFDRVNIREYERVLGDNPSVTSGPPLSIGWRYSPSTLDISIDDYEENKGSPRSSSEYLVPKSIRVATLEEHAVPHREMVNAVRAVQKTKSQRRKTVVNLSMASTEELVEKAKIKVKSILRPSLSYSLSEAKLWDEAHARATEKARELEESLQRGNGVSKRDLLSVGTPINMIMPSRRNSSIDTSDGRSIPISSSADAAIEVVESTRRPPPPPQSTAKLGSKTNLVNTTSTWINDGDRTLSPMSSTVGDSSFNGSIDMQDETKLDSTATTTGCVRSNSIIIVETGDDNEEDMLSRLLLDDAQDVK